MISEDKYIKLNVIGLLDLEMLSREYQMQKNELVDFHNSHCDIGELLPLNLPKYVPFIYIPKNNFESRNGKLLSHNTLKYPAERAEKKFGVILKYLHSDTQIHFEVIIKRENGYIEIDKKKTFVNHTEIDNLIEKLYEKSESALYPLKVSVNSDGGFSKIANEKEITDRWATDIYPKLKEYYVGKVAEEILEKMDRTFLKISSKRELISRSIFYQLLFLPVFQTYPDYKRSNTLKLYFAKIKKDISYDIQYFLNREYTRGTKIALHITGKEHYDSFFDNEEKGTLDLLYKFQKETHELFSITGSASAFDKGREYKIEFQMFEI